LLPPITDDAGSWAAIVGILLPFAAAFIQKIDWGDPQRTSMVNAAIFAACVVVASLVYAAIKYDLTWAHWESSLLAVLVWGIATFHTYWRPAGFIEAARTAGPVK